ncbi:MAG: DUF2442 domain-containing protein [Desulfobulbaceae bacterium]|nr:DUF2442 domain-containing protein [Desulfobulbaceae bacterium]
MIISLIGGRCISAPLSWYPRLAWASPRERENDQLIGGCEDIHWSDIDEGISNGWHSAWKSILRI